MNRPAIFSHSLTIQSVGTTRQLLGLDQAGTWHILAQLPPMTDARALLIDRKALARALQFRLIDVLPAPKPHKLTAGDRATAIKLIALALGAALLALKNFVSR